MNAKVLQDLNLREMPPKGKIIKVLPEGTVVKVSDYNWAIVTTSDGKLGLVWDEYLEYLEDEREASESPEVTQNWLEIAKKEIGIHEVTGGENPRIIEYFTAVSYHAQEDEVPWCAAFANWVLKKAGIKGTNSAVARSFEGWGEELEDPRKGAIIVFDWQNGSGHVGFIYSWTDSSVAVLGGNQSDQVSITNFKWDNVSAMRWPEATTQV